MARSFHFAQLQGRKHWAENRQECHHCYRNCLPKCFYLIVCNGAWWSIRIPNYGHFACGSYMSLFIVIWGSCQAVCDLGGSKVLKKREKDLVMFLRLNRKGQTNLGHGILRQSRSSTGSRVGSSPCGAKIGCEVPKSKKNLWKGNLGRCHRLVHIFHDVTVSLCYYWIWCFQSSTTTSGYCIFLNLNQEQSSETCPY